MEAAEAAQAAERAAKEEEEEKGHDATMGGVHGGGVKRAREERAGDHVGDRDDEREAGGGGKKKRAREESSAAQAAVLEYDHVLVAEVGDDCPATSVLHWGEDEDEEEEGADEEESDDDDDDDDDDDNRREKSSLTWEQRSDELLASLVYPMAPKDFMARVHRKKALAVHGPSDRFHALAEAHLGGLDVAAMVEGTASDNIFVWMPSRSGGGGGALNSWEMDDPAAAIKCFDSGASLYFRSPQEMAEAYVRALSHATGFNFAGVYGDGGDLRGEIECFVSRPGHVTPWHLDFMDNWSLQLRGSKRWTLKRGPQHPLRGCTPHYKGLDTFEQQLKVHRQRDPAFRLQPGAEFFADADSVVLRPGSFLYHPAGIWHHVATEGSEDSVSVNVSLMPASWADVATAAVRQALLRRGPWGEPVCLRREPPLFESHCSAEEAAAGAAAAAPVVAAASAGAPARWASDYATARRQAAALLARLKRDVSELTVDDLLPPALVLPRREAEDVAARVGAALPADARYRVNPLSVLFRADDAVADRGGGDQGEDRGRGGRDTPGAQQADVAFVVHTGFGGEELASSVRRVVRAQTAAEAEALDALAAGTSAFGAAERPGLTRALLARLVDAGHLVMLPPDQ